MLFSIVRHKFVRGFTNCMVRKEFIDRIKKACYIDYYLSANDGCRNNWPFRMQPVHEASQTYSDASDKYVIDSSISDLTISNKDVLDKGYELDADAVLLCDYMPFDFYAEKDLNDSSEEKLNNLRQEYGGNYNASVESIKKGIKMYKKHKYNGEIWIPIQQPHVEFFYDVGKPDKVAVGGVKDSDSRKKIDCIKTVRSEAKDAYIHGLGFGATEILIKEVKRNPKLIDSIDSQTPLSKAMNDFHYESGKEVMSCVSGHTEAFLIEKCRRMSPLRESVEGVDDGMFSF